MDFKTETPTEWYADESLLPLKNYLETKPPHLKVVSFDFFDTLVHRLCGDPADIFVEVGRRLAKENLLLRPISPTEFRDVRIAADRRARKVAQAAGRNVEIALPEFYAQMTKVVSDPAAAMAIELQTERNYTFRNDNIVGLLKFVRSLRLKTAIVSDTYFLKDHIVTLLRDCQIDPAWFDAILLSNERGGGKWQGHLFRETCQVFGIHPSELLHIGDNPTADEAMALACGAEAVLYHRTTPAQNEIFAIERTLQNPARPPATSLRFVRTSLARQAQGPDDAFRDGAFVFGPVLTHYADWCVQTFAQAGVKKVLALMREGELLGELVARAAANAGLKLEVHPCYVSRLSTARASMAELSCEGIERLLEGNNGLNTGTILEILGVLAEGKRYLGEDLLLKPLNTQAAIRRVVAQLLKLDRLRSLIDDARKNAHQLAYEYLHDLTGDEPLVGVIDLGWSGSIQKNITQIMRLGGRQVQTLGCYFGTTPRAAELRLDGDEGRSYLNCPWTGSTILAEISITACVGSTNGYKRGPDGKVAPVLGRYSISDSEHSTKMRLRQGVLAFQDRWQQLKASRQPFSPEMDADLAAESHSILTRMIDFPSAEEARRLGILVHDENYWGDQLSKPLCGEASAQRLAREGIGGLFENPESYWPQGVIALHEPRLMSAIAQPWITGKEFGLVGSNLQGNGDFSGDEVISLAALLQELQPQQLVLIGHPSAPEKLPVFFAGTTLGASSPDHRSPSPGGQTTWREIPVSEPHLIVVDSTGRDTRNPADNRAVAIETDLRCGRRRLSPCRRAALLLSACLAEDQFEKALREFAPFLGPEGIIAVAHARTPSEQLDVNRLLLALDRWLQNTGLEFGFRRWEMPRELKHHGQNWTVISRDPVLYQGPAYWSLRPEDLPILEFAKSAAAPAALA